MTKKEMTYEGVGINYKEMDPFKIMAQQAAVQTAGNLHRLGIAEVSESRGESAYVIDMGGWYLAFVEEGLGTKNVAADEMYKLTGKSYYDQASQCTMAMIVNDLITVGADPLAAMMHLAAGASAWFSDKQRCQEVVNGWQQACNLAGCSWGGGETPTLKKLIYPETVVMAGSAIGIIRSQNDLLLGSKIENGDAILVIKSSGIHANGLTLAREIADKLPEGYLTKMPSGRPYGDVLLDATLIYAPLLRALQEAGIELHYAINITGHGWRKLMRAQRQFTYVIEDLPEVPEIFPFMQEHGPISLQEAYENLNMGGGFAFYLPYDEVEQAIEIANKLGFGALLAGYIKSGERKVVLEPVNLIFGEETLQVR